MVPLKADNRPRVQDGKSRWDLNVRYLEKFIVDGYNLSAGWLRRLADEILVLLNADEIKRYYCINSKLFVAK